MFSGRKKADSTLLLVKLQSIVSPSRKYSITIHRKSYFSATRFYERLNWNSLTAERITSNPFLGKRFKTMETPDFYAEDVSEDVATKTQYRTCQP